MRRFGIILARLPIILGIPAFFSVAHRRRQNYVIVDQKLKSKGFKMTAKKAGRPPGSTYREDDVGLAMMADAIVKDSKLTPTAAARQACRSPRWKHRGSSEESVIERLVKKWRDRRVAELALARRRVAAASTESYPAYRSMAQLARSVPQGPPMFEIGRGQSQVVAAAATYDALLGRRIAEPATSVDTRLIDALRNPVTARSTPYNLMVEKIREITGADIVGKSHGEALRLFAEAKRRIALRFGHRSPQATRFGF
jgi:hypothetical protein